MKAKTQIVLYTALGLVLCVAAGLVFLKFHRNLVIMEASSMEPTIKQGQEVSIGAYAKGQQPQRDDIIEYSNTSADAKQYVKSGKLIHRVIGLPGERIVIADNKVAVYNSSYPNGFNPDVNLPLEGTTSGTIDEVVPPNSYFVLGDNRPNALDSRVIGPVAQSDIIGKVRL